MREKENFLMLSYEELKWVTPVFTVSARIQGDQTIERRTFPISSTLEKREKDVKRLSLLSKECYFP